MDNFVSLQYFIAFISCLCVQFHILCLQKLESKQLWKLKNCTEEDKFSFIHLIPSQANIQFIHSKGHCDRLLLALLFNNAKLPNESCKKKKKKKNSVCRQIVMNLKYNKYVLLLLLEIFKL